jgi:hypothetical protein
MQSFAADPNLRLLAQPTASQALAWCFNNQNLRRYPDLGRAVDRGLGHLPGLGRARNFRRRLRTFPARARCAMAQPGGSFIFFDVHHGLRIPTGAALRRRLVFPTRLTPAPSPRPSEPYRARCFYPLTRGF